MCLNFVRRLFRRSFPKKEKQAICICDMYESHNLMIHIQFFSEISLGDSIVCTGIYFFLDLPSTSKHTYLLNYSRGSQAWSWPSSYNHSLDVSLCLQQLHRVGPSGETKMAQSLYIDKHSTNLFLYVLILWNLVSDEVGGLSQGLTPTTHFKSRWLHFRVWPVLARLGYSEPIEKGFIAGKCTFVRICA